jgi:hypothetical protein
MRRKRLKSRLNNLFLNIRRKRIVKKKKKSSPNGMKECV